MKKYIVLVLGITFALFSCKNAMEKEVGEVEGLISMVNEIEKTVLSIDTAKAFQAKRQISKDLALIESLGDTLDKQSAFMLDDYYSGKKRLYRFYNNYKDFIIQIDYSKEQLNNLKQDLNNGIVTKEKFKEYYMLEQASVMELNSKVNKSVGGIEESIQKMELQRPDILALFEELKQRTPVDE